MQLVTASACILHRFEQHRMAEEFAILNHQLNSRRIHMDNAPCADVQMSDFAVAHLIVGQADVLTTGVNQSVGILAQQAVVSWLASKCNGIGISFGSITPAVENGENEWFGTGQSLAPGF